MAIKVGRQNGTESQWLNSYLKAKKNAVEPVLRTKIASRDDQSNRAVSDKDRSIREGFVALATSDITKRLWNTENRDCMYMSAILDAVIQDAPEKLAKLASSSVEEVDRMKEYFDYMYSSMRVRHPSVADALKYYGDKVGLTLGMEPIGKTASDKCDNCGCELEEKQEDGLCDVCHQEEYERDADDQLFPEAKSKNSRVKTSSRLGESAVEALDEYGVLSRKIHDYLYAHPDHSSDVPLDMIVKGLHGAKHIDFLLSENRATNEIPEDVVNELEEVYESLEDYAMQALKMLSKKQSNPPKALGDDEVDSYIDSLEASKEDKDLLKKFASAKTLKKFAIDSAAKSYFDQIFEDSMGSYEFSASEGNGSAGPEYDSNSYRKDTTMEYLDERRKSEQRWQTRSEHEMLEGQNGNPKEGYDVTPSGSTNVLEEGQKTVDIIPSYTNSGKVRTNQEAHDLRVELTETLPTGIGANWFGAVPHEKEELRKIWDISEEVGKDGVVDLAAALKKHVRTIRANHLAEEGQPARYHLSHLTNGMIVAGLENFGFYKLANEFKDVVKNKFPLAFISNGSDIDTDIVRQEARNAFAYGDKVTARRLRKVASDVDFARERYLFFLDKIATMDAPKDKIAEWNIFVSNLMVDSKESFGEWANSGKDISAWARDRFSKQSVNPQQLVAEYLGRLYHRYASVGDDRAAREIRKIASANSIFMRKNAAGYIDVGLGRTKRAFSFGDAGGLALDALQFVPGLGEGIGLVRMINAARKGKYLEAAFYAITLLPIAGDAVGTGLKWLYKLGPKAFKSPAVVKRAKPLIDKAVQAWPKVKNTIEDTLKNSKHKKEVLRLFKLADASMSDFLDETKQSLESAIKEHGIDGLVDKAKDFMTGEPLAAAASMKIATEYIMDEEDYPLGKKDEKPDPVKRWNEILKERGLAPYKDPKQKGNKKKWEAGGEADFYGERLPEGTDPEKVVYEDTGGDKDRVLTRDWFDRKTYKRDRVDEEGQSRINEYFSDAQDDILRLAESFSDIGAVAELVEEIANGSVNISTVEDAASALGSKLATFSRDYGDEEDSEMIRADLRLLKQMLDDVLGVFPETEREMDFAEGEGANYSFEKGDYVYWDEEGDENSGWVATDSPVDRRYVLVSEGETVDDVINFRDPKETRSPINHSYRKGDMVMFERDGDIVTGKVQFDSGAKDNSVAVIVNDESQNIAMGNIAAVQKGTASKTKVDKGALTRVILKDPPVEKKMASFDAKRLKRLARLKKANPDLYKKVVKSPLLQEAHPTAVVGDGFYREDAAQEEDMKAATNPPSGKQGGGKGYVKTAEEDASKNFVEMAYCPNCSKKRRFVDGPHSRDYDSDGKHVECEYCGDLKTKTKEAFLKSAKVTKDDINLAVQQIDDVLSPEDKKKVNWDEFKQQFLANPETILNRFFSGGATDLAHQGMKGLMKFIWDKAKEWGSSIPVSSARMRMMDRVVHAAANSLVITAKDDKDEDDTEEEEVKSQTKQVRDFYEKTAEYDETTGSTEYSDEDKEDESEDKINPHDPHDQKKQQIKNPEPQVPSLFASADLENINGSIFRFNRDDYIEFTTANDAMSRGWVKKIGPSKLIVDMGGKEISIAKESVKRVSRGSFDDHAISRMRTITDDDKGNIQEGDEIGFRSLDKPGLEYGTVLQSFGEGVGDGELIVSPFGDDGARMRVPREDVVKMWRYQ